MGRTLQKKKARSSVPKVRQKPKSNKRMLHNPIIAANWDHKQTLSQNYRRLGLTSRLNHATGGTEKTIKLLGLNDPNSSRADSAADSTANKLNIVSSAPKSSAVEEVEVERDPETGRIIRIINDPTQERAHRNPLNDPLNDIEDEDDEGDEWNGFAMVPERRPGEEENPVIQQLEEAARNGVRVAPRSQSQREEEWLERLVNKYGEDYGAMFRDRKLNPMQQSQGDLKRRITKWKKNHGRA